MASLCGVSGTACGALFYFYNKEAQSWSTAAYHPNLQFDDSILVSVGLKMWCMRKQDVRCYQSRNQEAQNVIRRLQGDSVVQGEN